MLGIKIREIMKLRGIGNNDLAAKSGVPIGTLNKILNGESKSPKYSTVESIARALGCTTDDFADSGSTDTSIKDMTEAELDEAIEKEGAELIGLINQLTPQRQQALIEFLRAFVQSE